MYKDNTIIGMNYSIDNLNDEVRGPSLTFPSALTPQVNKPLPPNPFIIGGTDKTAAAVNHIAQQLLSANNLFNPNPIYESLTEM